MGALHIPEALERAIERQVSEGRAETPVAFVEEAVMRLIDAAELEQAEIALVVEAGIADAEAGRYVTIATSDDRERLRRQVMEEVEARLAADE